MALTGSLESVKRQLGALFVVFLLAVLIVPASKHRAAQAPDVNLQLELVKRLRATQVTGDFELTGRILNDGKRAVFIANDGVHGQEVWTTDGVTMRRVSDLTFGAGDGNVGTLYGTPDHFGLLASAGAAYARFAIGTPEGVALINDPTLLGGNNFLICGPLVSLGDGRFVFAAVDASGRPQLWRSDGTQTERLTEFAVGEAARSFGAFVGFGLEAYRPLRNGSLVYYFDNQGLDQWKLLNPTTGVSTTITEEPELSDIYVIKSGSHAFLSGENIFVSSATDTEVNTSLLRVQASLYRSDDMHRFEHDGALYAPITIDAGYPRLAKLSATTIDITPAGVEPSVKHFIRAANGRLLFNGKAPSDAELYESTTINAAPTKHNLLDPGSSNPTDFVNLNDDTYFVATNATGRKLYKYRTGSVEVASPAGLTVSGPTIAHGGYVYFVGNDGIHGNELWRTNGSSTTMLADLDLGNDSSTPDTFIALDNVLLFRANNGISGKEFFSVDPAGNVVAFPDFNKQPPSNVRRVDTLRALGDQKWIFLADNGTSGAELWSTDGTASGTVLLKNIDNASASAVVTQPQVVGGLAYFVAQTATGEELFVTDGTPAGTTQITQLQNPSGPNVAVARIPALTVTDNAVFFSVKEASDPAQVGVMYRAHGGAAIGRAHQTTSAPEWLFAMGNDIVYEARGTGDSSSKIFKASATAASDVALRDACSGCDERIGNGWTFKDTPYFFGRTGPASTNYEILKSAGTTDTTNVAINLVAGDVGLTQYSVTAFPDKLDPLFNGIRTQVTDQRFYLMLGDQLVSVHEGNATPGLWVSDGTQQGTRRLFAQDKGAIGTPRGPVVELGDRVLHDGYRVDVGTELWSTAIDGSGSVLVKDIAQGIASSEPRGMTKLVNSDYILFAAGDDEHGVELWKTKGTAETTSLAIDINVGRDSSSPHDFFTSGEFIYFFANDGLGEALYRLNAGALLLAPVADAGPDQSASASALAVALNGMASKDSDGVIVSYGWTQIAGPTATLDGSNTSQALVGQLTPGGEYDFVLSVTDNDGLTAEDTVHVSVSTERSDPNGPNGGSNQANGAIGRSTGCKCGSSQVPSEWWLIAAGILWRSRRTRWVRRIK